MWTASVKGFPLQRTAKKRKAHLRLLRDGLVVRAKVRLPGPQHMRQLLPGDGVGVDVDDQREVLNGIRVRVGLRDQLVLECTQFLVVDLLRVVQPVLPGLVDFRDDLVTHLQLGPPVLRAVPFVNGNLAGERRPRGTRGPAKRRGVNEN